MNSVRIWVRWLALELRPPRPGPGTLNPARRRRVLLLVEQFPPSLSGGVYRPLSFAQYAGESRWDVAVASCGVPQHVGPAGDELRRRLPPDVPVHELAIAAPPLSTRLTPVVDGGLYRALETVRRVAALDLATPDVILASAPSFNVFIAAYFLRRRTGARLALDYRDEWSECPFGFVHRGRLDRWWERRCLRSSDLAIYTTESMRRHAVRVFGAAMPRTTVLPNGIDGGVRPVGSCGEPPPPGRARLAFFGTAFSHAAPGEFLRTLDAVLERRRDLRDRLELCWVGRQDARVRLDLERFPHPEMVRVLPVLPQPEARGLMREAAALLIFGGVDWARYRPCKLYDYLASHRPVVAYGGTGEIAEVIESLRAGVMVREGDPEALERVLEAVATGRLAVPDTTAVDRWLANYDRRKIAAALFRQLDEVLVDDAVRPASPS